MPITDKPLPYNKYAEQKIIGCLLKNNKSLDKIVNILEEIDFCVTEYKILYRIIKAIISSGETATIIRLFEALRQQKLDKQVSGELTIQNIVTNISDTDLESLEYYASIVRQKSEKRKLIRLGLQIQIEGYNSKPANEILQGIEENLLHFKTKPIQKWDIKETLGNLYDYLERFLKDNKGIISTGWEEIDFVLKGLKAPRIYLFGGLRGEGKTSFFIALAQNVILQGLKVLYFSLEMSKEEILLRMLQGVALVPNYKIEAPKSMTSEEWNRLAGAISEISTWPLVVCDGSYTVAQFEIEIKDHRPDLVIVDHIDYMTYFTGREVQVPFFLGDVIVKSKQLAKKYNTPMVYASQLKQEAEDIDIAQYTLDLYKGSRGKGDNIDIGGFIQWKDKSSDIFKWRISKNRFGILGHGMLYFDPKYGTFKRRR